MVGRSRRKTRRKTLRRPKGRRRRTVRKREKSVVFDDEAPRYTYKKTFKHKPEQAS